MTPQNLEKHQKCITGSKIASILGLPGAYDSAYTLFARMKGVLPWQEGNDLMLAGNCAELAIAEWCRLKYGWNLIEGPPDGMYHPVYPFIFGLVDRLKKNSNGVIDSIVEFKNQHWSQAEKWEDGIPEKFKAQCYLYSAIYGLPCQVVACFGGSEYVRYSLPRDTAIEAFILEMGCQFWADLQDYKWPDPDASGSSIAALKHIYKAHSDVLIPGTEEMALWASEYQRASEEEKIAKKKKESLGNYFKLVIKGDLGIDLGGGRMVTWKETIPKVSKFNERSFLIDHPELYDQYSELPESSRRLNVKI